MKSSRSFSPNLTEGEKIRPFSSPEAALLLVGTKNRDLWAGPTPEVRDSDWLRIRNELSCKENQVRPEVAILGADQK